MTHLFRIAIVFTVAIFLSSCATTFVRSERPSKDTIYGATQFDAEFLWETGIKGQPLFVSNHAPSARNSWYSRILFSLGSIVDLPFSLASDTLFLPLDLFLPEKDSENDKEEASPE